MLSKRSDPTEVFFVCRTVLWDRTLDIRSCKFFENGHGDCKHRNRDNFCTCWSAIEDSLLMKKLEEL